MTEIRDQISELAEKALPDEKHFIVDIQVKGKKGTGKVLVLVDSDDGISLESCSAISRKLSQELDIVDLFEGKYTLEVSSPGIDFPLSSARQFRKNTGRHVEIRKTDGKTITGRLSGVTEQGIEINVDKHPRSGEEIFLIGFNEIELAKVIVMFH